MNPPTNPVDCPRFNTCNAPTCPLDPQFTDAPTLRGEPVCRWLREAVKADGGGDRIPAEIAPAVHRAIPLVLKDGGAYIRSELGRAAKCLPKSPPVCRTL